MQHISRAIFILATVHLYTSHLFAADHTRKEREYIARYKLPAGNISAKLDETFKRIKDPKEAFRLAGWTILKEDADIVVAQHPAIPEWIVKAPPRAKKSAKYLYLERRNLGRIIFLEEVIRPYIEQHRIELEQKGFTVALPRKYIYCIRETNTHVIVAANMNLANNSSIKTKDFFASPEHKAIMHKIINDLVHFDAGANNVAITEEEALALIDTEARRLSGVKFLDRIRRKSIQAVHRRKFDGGVAD